jgi:hypothetical protein
MKLPKLSTRQIKYISEHWAEVASVNLLDYQYGELSPKIRKLYHTKLSFKNKINNDIWEFANNVYLVKELHAMDLLETDYDNCLYLTKKPEYTDFMYYVSTECRSLYRAFFRMKGYEDFKKPNRIDFREEMVNQYMAYFEAVGIENFYTR